MNYRLITLPGDGVGPEVVPIAVEILRCAIEGRGHQLDVDERLIGWAATQAEGGPLSDDTIKACIDADAVLLGAVGHPAAEKVPPAERPEAGLLGLRSALGCYANLRPAKAYAPIVDCSPLQPEFVSGTDLVIVRELAGGLYYGKSGVTGSANRRRATDTESYSVTEIRRIAKYGFDLARGRRKSVTSIDKANVLSSSRLWREIVTEVSADYPDVKLSHMLVDRAAMELVLRPKSFDVMLMSNLFGDILSDEAAGVVGSIGLLGSASLGGRTDLYEPVHGSAPDIAGQDKANPIGAIVSVVMMLRHTFKLEKEARVVEVALDQVLENGLRTPDIVGKASSSVGTQAFGRAVFDAVESTRESAAAGKGSR